VRPICDHPTHTGAAQIQIFEESPIPRFSEIQDAALPNMKFHHIPQQFIPCLLDNFPTFGPGFSACET
jgi:hypothetical protein